MSTSMSMSMLVIMLMMTAAQVELAAGNWQLPVGKGYLSHNLNKNVYAVIKSKQGDSVASS